MLLVYPKQPPKKRGPHIRIPKGYTGLGYIKTDGSETILQVGNRQVLVRAQKRTNVAPGLKRAQFRGLLCLAYNERVYLFLGLKPVSIGESVCSLYDPKYGTVLVNLTIRLKAPKL